MKKCSVLTAILALTLAVCSFCLSTAIAAINSDPCEVGDHDFILIDSDISYYGAQRHFTVSGCSYASYPHDHYYLMGTMRLTYTCANCGYTKTVSIQYDNLSAGETCTLHDFGR